MTIKTIVTEATRRGVTLEPLPGDKLRVLYGDDDLDACLEAKLRANKLAIIKWLRSRRHLATQVLSSEFSGANRPTILRAIIELMENQNDPLCWLAVKRLISQYDKHPNLEQ